MTDQRFIGDDPDKPAPRTIAIGDGVRADITIPHRYGRFPVVLSREARAEDQRRRDVLRGMTAADAVAIARVLDPVQVTIGQRLLRVPEPARFTRNPGQGAILGYHCAVEETHHASGAGILYKSTRLRWGASAKRSQAKRRKIERGH